MANLTTLGLLNCFLAFGINEMEPLWNYAPKLTHLHLSETTTGLIIQDSTWSTPEKEEMLDMYIRGVFSGENGWLDLAHPACRIQEIAMNIYGLDSDLNSFAPARLRDLSENLRIPSIKFQFKSKSAFDDIGDEWRKWGTTC
ncbi:hypothetical protein BDN70DRAFT_931581 [Pholiota conissans]|uniref:Uncharacterized protein n=1 Tax=Pholiota conissans TaxID=109636 RepID=A0A9P5Z3Q3_9AGAR|nr:hypothetical protein BDN70DRAFT_931581 [Pholiota conissans]